RKIPIWLLPRNWHPKKLAPCQTIVPNDESLTMPTLQPVVETTSPKQQDTVLNFARSNRAKKNPEKLNKTHPEYRKKGQAQQDKAISKKHTEK
ncbi:15611_t:CDS:2, partial [Gigaspora rosea]